MDNPIETQKQIKEERSLLDIYASISVWTSFFLKQWWVLGLVTVLGGIIGIWIAYKDKPQYESRLTFALDDGGSDAGGFSGIAARFGINVGGSGQSFFSGDNILEIMKSRRIVQAVLLSTDTINGRNARMIQHFINFRKQSSKDENVLVSFPIETNRINFTDKQDSVLLELADQFSAKLIQAKKPDKKLDIYEVNILSPNEHFTKVFTDRIVQETINFYTELRSKKSKETLDILEQRVSSMKGNLNSSIVTRSSIQDANLNPAFAAAQAPLQKQTANIQVYGEAYAEMFKNLELARFQYLKEIPLLQIIDSANYPMKKIKKGRLKTGITYGAVFFFITIFFLTVTRIFKQLGIAVRKQSLNRSVI